MLYTTASVSSLKFFSSFYALLTLSEPQLSNEAKPGQFCMLTPYLCDEHNSSLFLKRPVSIFSVNRERGEISFYLQLLGKGSRFFSSLQPQDKIFVLGPLGRAFATRWTQKSLLFVGAGVGVAPFRYLFDVLSPENPQIHMIFAARDANAAMIRQEFTIPLSQMSITTGDGSVGESGNVVDVTQRILDDSSQHWDYIYVCGPPIVLEKIGSLAAKRQIAGQLSFEARMACGVRACQACSLQTKQGIQKICSFGPVFDIQNLVFDGDV